MCYSRLNILHDHYNNIINFIYTAKLVALDLNADTWWGLITLGLLIWACILTIVLFIICVVLCVDASNNKRNKYEESDSSYY